MPIFAYQLLGQLLKTDSYRAGSLEHTLYSHEISKLSRVSVWDCVSDVRCNFRTRSRLWRLPVNSKFSAALISSLQIFTDVISLEEKQMECIWRITCFEEDVLVVFPTGFDKRHDSKNDKIASPPWVVVVSLLEYKRKHQVEDLKNTRWRIESVLSLRDFF